MTQNLMDELMNDLPHDTCPNCRRLYTTEEVQKYGFGSALCPDCRTSQKIEITIAEDLDGFLGNDSQAIEQIDIEASQANYEKELTEAIHEFYPELVIHFDWGGARNNYFGFDGNEDELQSDLEMFEERVYNMQDFWVNKA